MGWIYWVWEDGDDVMNIWEPADYGYGALEEEKD